MKTKKIAAVLAVIFILAALPLSASAAEYGGSTTVSFEIDYTYEVHIPEFATLDKDSSFEITAMNVYVPSGQVLAVSLDMTEFENGKIAFHNEAGEKCYLSVYRKSINRTSLLTENDSDVAYFRTGDMSAFWGGEVSLLPKYTEDLTPGTYSGILHFVIEMIDYPQTEG